MMDFEIKYTKSDRIDRVLNGLFASLKPEFRYEVLRKVATVYYSETRKRFDNQYDVDRKKWKVNTLATRRLKRKGISGKNGRIAAVNGENHVGVWTSTLAAGLKVEFGSNEVRIGSNEKYAKTFHYGAKKGDFGSWFNPWMRKDQPIPWGDIHPRRFLGRNKRLDDQVYGIIKDEMTKRIGSDLVRDIGL